MKLLRKILVIRRDNIGDLVCTTPALAALRAHYPNSEIAVLVNSYNNEVLHRNPNIDKIFVYTKIKHASGASEKFKAIVARLALIFQIRIWCPDVAILAKSGFDRYGLRMAKVAGSKNILGYLPKGVLKGRGLASSLIPCSGVEKKHEVEAIAKLLEPLGIYEACGSLKVYPEIDSVEIIKKTLLKEPIKVGLHVSAREAQRRWGEGNFQSLIKILLERRSDVQVLLMWSPGKQSDPRHPGDDELAAQIINSTQGLAVAPLPTNSISDLVNAISVCDIFVGADGGAMHIAAGLDKKVLALFECSKSKLVHWSPWRVKSKVLHSGDPTHYEVSYIAVSTVLESLESLMSQD